MSSLHGSSALLPILLPLRDPAGFTEGQAGASFHYQHGFWCRYLVDAKVEQVQRYVREQDVDVPLATVRVWGVKASTLRKKAHSHRVMVVVCRGLHMALQADG